MSRIKYTIVELPEIVKQSNLIVFGEFVETYSEEIVPKGIETKTPFIKKGFVFRIKDVIKNSGKVEIPETIQVPNEDWRRSFSQYKEEYGGASKSFEVRKYETDVKSVKKAEILFLHQFQNTYELEVKDAFESTENLEKIEMLAAMREED